MTQRQQLHAVGTFPVCPDCGDELRHILDDRATDGGHCLSCCCGDSPKFASFYLLMAALEGWCDAKGLALASNIRSLIRQTQAMAAGYARTAR